MKLAKTNQDGLTHYLFFFVMLAVVVLVGYIGLHRIRNSSADTIGDFTYVATHPQAVNQPTAKGKAILTLKAWNGKLYAGYGDYGANTGPIDITPFDPTTNTFASTTSLVDGTEQIAIYRLINSKLYAPAIDPSYLSLSSFYADASDASSWTQALVGKSGGLDMDHVFDINTLTGSDLWLAGSKGNDAVVWHSTDGGTTWTKSYDLAVANRAERFYSIGSFNGKLYVQASATDIANTTVYQLESNSHVFDGTNWTTGPALAPGMDYIWHPEVFAGQMVYMNFCPCNATAAGMLFSLNANNTAQQITLPAYVDDFTADGSTLYVLANNGTVYSTTDLTNWYVQRTGPTTAHSVGVLNGQIYVGTSDSKLYRASVNPSPSPVGGSTSGGGTKHSGGGAHKK